MKFLFDIAGGLLDVILGTWRAIKQMERDVHKGD